MDIDRKRIAAVRALETLRYTYSGGEWFPPVGAASAEAGHETDGDRGGETAYRRVQQTEQAALESRINDVRKALYH